MKGKTKWNCLVKEFYRLIEISSIDSSSSAWRRRLWNRYQHFLFVLLPKAIALKHLDASTTLCNERHVNKQINPRTSSSSAFFSSQPQQKLDQSSFALIFVSSVSEQFGTFPRTFLILSHSNSNFFIWINNEKFFLFSSRPVLLVTRFSSLSTRDKWFIWVNSSWRF